MASYRVRIKVHFKDSKGNLIKTVEANEGDDLLEVAHEYDIDLEGKIRQIPAVFPTTLTRGPTCVSIYSFPLLADDHQTNHSCIATFP